MNSLKLRKVGDAVVVTIPAAVLERYNLKEGDRLNLDQGSESFTLKPDHAEPGRRTAIRMMEKYSSVLKRLAK